MDVLEWIRGIVTINTTGKDIEPIRGLRTVTCLVLDYPIVLTDTEELDWSLTIRERRSMNEIMCDNATGLHNIKLTAEGLVREDWGADQKSVADRMQEDLLNTVRYAACPNAMYNARHVEDGSECKWCDRRKAVLEYLNSDS